MAASSARAQSLNSADAYRDQLVQHIATFQKTPVSQPDVAADAISHALGSSASPAEQAVILEDYGHLFEIVEDYSDAWQLYTRAVSILKGAFGEDDLRTAKAYRSLALVSLQLGDALAAEPLYESALQTQKRHLGENNADTAETIFELAADKDALGKASAAEPLYRQALAIERAKLGRDPIVADHAISLIDFYLVAGRPGDAEPLCREALAIVVPRRGERDRLAILAYSKLGESLTAQKRYAAARPYVERAMQLGRSTFGVDDLQTATLEVNAAEALDTSERFSEATPLYAHALGVYRKTPGGGTQVARARLLLNYAQNLHRQGRLIDAEPIDRAALLDSRLFIGEDSGDTGIIYGFLGEDFAARGKQQESIANYQQAIAILDPKRAVSGPLAVGFNRALAAKLAALGRASDAAYYSKRADTIGRSSTCACRRHRE
jgi:tetratricopeptide (TPR) repeat protein